MVYRLRVYWRYWRPGIKRFNAQVRETSWGSLLESCFWLGFAAVVLLSTPVSTVNQLFERVIWPAVQHAMIGWLCLVPLALVYTGVVKHWRR